MDAVCRVKREIPTEFENCLICQETRKEKLLNGSEQGFLTIQDAAHSRAKLRDPQNRIVIEQIHAISTTEERQKSGMA